MEVSEIFLTFVVTSFIAVFGVTLKYCLKSKCSDINLCFGMVSVQRDIDAEVEEERNELEFGVKEETKV